MADSSEGFPAPLVSTEWLAGHLNEPGLVVLDTTAGRLPGLPTNEGWVNQRDRYLQGHIPGARHTDVLDEFSERDSGLPLTRPTAAHFDASAGALGISPDSRVVVYHRNSGHNAARLWWLFRAFGHAQVAVLDGGIGKWIREGRPLETGGAEFEPTSYVSAPREKAFWDKPDVVDVVAGRQSALLLNALDTDDFLGIASKPGRTRKGRIPGSVNVPALFDFIRADGTLIPIDELRAALSPAVGIAGQRTIVAYCGAGVAASTALLGLVTAGVTNVGLYDGSLAEWSADLDLPIVTGPEPAAEGCA